jgi:hypothetical protein
MHVFVSLIQHTLFELAFYLMDANCSFYFIITVDAVSFCRAVNDKLQFTAMLSGISQ